MKEPLRYRYRWPVWLLLLSFATGTLGVRKVLHTAGFLEVAAQQDDSSWRKTKQGWLDSANWNRPSPKPAERGIELVHPLLFSVGIVLISTGFLIWASEEKHWADLVDNTGDAVDQESLPDDQ